MKVFLSIFVIYLSLSLNLKAQVKLTADFQNRLDDAEIDFITPLEANYKKRTAGRSPFQPYDYGIYSRKEKLEIRYLIDPQKGSTHPIFYAPQVRSMQIVSHIASNDEAAHITRHAIPDIQLKEEFNADWGKVFYFQPKLHFSTRKHCRMLALYREGKGMAFIFFLFDKADRALDNRFLALRFR